MRFPEGAEHPEETAVRPIRPPWHPVCDFFDNVLCEPLLAAAQCRVVQPGNPLLVRHLSQAQLLQIVDVHRDAALRDAVGPADGEGTQESGRREIRKGGTVAQSFVELVGMSDPMAEGLCVEGSRRSPAGRSRPA